MLDLKVLLPHEKTTKWKNLKNQRDNLQVNSKENYKNKARNFSIHCYVFEKLRFIRKKDFPITNDELIEIKYLIDRIINEKDINIDGLISNYIQLLKQKDKIGLLHMQPGDRYYQILNKKSDIVEDYDKLIESYQGPSFI